jgi:hypothetical protein
VSQETASSSSGDFASVILVEEMEERPLEVFVASPMVWRLMNSLRSKFPVESMVEKETVPPAPGKVGPRELDERTEMMSPAVVE